MGSHRRHIRSNIVIRASVFVLLGAIVNVAVAWGCALSAKVTRTESLTENGKWYWLVEQGWQPLPDRESVTYHNKVLMLEGIGVKFEAFFETEFPSNAMSGPSMYYSASSAGKVEAGWPFGSLHGRYFDPAMITRKSIRGAFIQMRKDEELPIVPNANSTTSVFVPYRRIGQWEIGGRFAPIVPKWPGFAINTLFYAAILWGLFAAPFAIRRRRRIKHGLCPACAYPVGASDKCTECGKPVRGTASS